MSRGGAAAASWRLVYSTATHGYSLQNLYRRLARWEPPLLLAVQDVELNVFGAYLTAVPAVTEEFVGTGESFLFRFPSAEEEEEEEHETEGGDTNGDGDSGNSLRVCVSKWTGSNDYVFQGKQNCLVVGAGDGHFGLYVDGNLDRGHVDACDTFGGGWPGPAGPRDFKVKCMECFSFK